METQALIAGAKQARETAYAPYSRYKVGAAVVTEEGYVFFGNNVENASYGLSLCAERSAISSAIVAGACKIIAIVLVTEAKPPGTPCGACRQWLAEFGGEDLEVICANVAGQTVHTTLGKLLPNAFRL
jgi:cytidine deaminase